MLNLSTLILRAFNAQYFLHLRDRYYSDIIIHHFAQYVHIYSESLKFQHLFIVIIIDVQKSGKKYQKISRLTLPSIDVICNWSDV